MSACCVFLVRPLFTERLSSLAGNQISDISSLGAALATNNTLTTLTWVVCMLAFVLRLLFTQRLCIVFMAIKSATYQRWEQPWPPTTHLQRWRELSTCWFLCYVYYLRKGRVVLVAIKSAIYQPWERPWPPTPHWQRWSKLSACLLVILPIIYVTAF